MFDEESLEERQRSELELLQSMYENQLTDLRGKAAWNKWSPLNLIISLTPQQGGSGCQEVYVKLDLHVICDYRYPNSVPKIHIKNPKGLSKTTLQELQDSLERKAEELKGEVMIFQLSQLVGEFLHKYNKPTSQSFYDEMIKRQKEQEEKEKQAQKLELDRQRQSMMEELQRMRENLKTEGRKRKESRRSNEVEDESSTSRFSLPSSAESSGESMCEHKMKVIDIGQRQIHRGRCLKHASPNHVVFNGIDSESGELLIITEWMIPVTNKGDSSNVQKQINSIEQELHYLTRLKHNNLAHYYGFKYVCDGDNFIVHVVKEFVYGSSCTSLFLNQGLTVGTDLLKHIAKGVLVALDYLHRNNVVHRDLGDKCVYLGERGCIKVSNFSIHKRLSDLITHSHGDYGKKNDIFRFGIFLLSLIRGKIVVEDNLKIPDTLQTDLYDLLTRCLAKQESDRYTTSRLLNHPFFHKPVVHTPLERLNVKVETERNISPEIVSADLKNMSNVPSRIKNEFEYLQHLGKGAYGDVFKVQNKLDGRYYAIKRIKLNPKKRTLNKKIVREVKLLSRLNHENIVRYYNSWLETTTSKKAADAGSEDEAPKEKRPIVVRKDEFSLDDDIEALAPAMKSEEVSIKSQTEFSDSSSESSSESWDEDGSGDDSDVRAEDASDSDGIEFVDETDGTSKAEASLSNTEITESTKSSPEKVTRTDFMFIQMEFCEKSTLRTAIDKSLYLNEDRVWRLFREIVEGLVHIHQQGMIHRDLKPVNIFLDSNDHVKIGDFGLATTSIKMKQNEQMLSLNVADIEKEDTVDESRTGLVGTALYVAPEINVTTRVVYNQKVDIYSLGIILFEMCYKPLNTSMERIKILTKLRQADIMFPEDFKNEKSLYVIRWLLDHDYSKRPTSQELLQSEHVPPPVFEERELRELVRHTLSNTQSKGYKYLIASCFKQPVTFAQDITYYDNVPSAPNTTRPLHLYDFVKQTCETVFKRHGGQNISTPLLMPKTGFYEDIESCVNLMTHFGSIVSLPHDLRVPFARYIAWTGIVLFRRYSIERVYREKKVFGFQPRELFECAFDIVTPTQGCLMADAEILYIVYEILNRLPGIRNKHFVIRLNHASLLKAIFLHCGIKDKHQEIYNMISDIKDSKTYKLQIQNKLISLGLPDHLINWLLNLFYSEFEISKAASHFLTITKKKQGEAAQLARQALDELKMISQNAVLYGVTFDIVLSPGLVYNIQHYSGVIYQIVCELKKKHKHKNMEVVAAGGRYDSLISSYRTIFEPANLPKRGVQQSAVGISISMDRLVQALQKEQSEDMPMCDVVAVCSVGNKLMIKEKTKVMRNLWAAGIKSVVIESTNIKEIEDMQSELRTSHIIILKDSEQGTVRVRSLERDRVQERNFSSTELVDNMLRILKNRHESIQESSSFSQLSRSESKSSYSERYDSTSQDVDILFMDKISSNGRKRYEIQISSQLDGVFKKLTGSVIVLCLFLESSLLKTIASYLDFENEDLFHRSVDSVTERHSRHRKIIGEVCDEIYKHKTNRRNPTLVLFSLSDNGYRVIL